MALEAFVGLGSNLGDREAHLRGAFGRLAPLGEMGRTSSIYETEPWGFPDQPPFLNAICSLRLKLDDPIRFLASLKGIENALGRTSSERWGPREIDLDLLFWSQAVINNDSLTCPHPRISERRFVLVGLCEIAPDLTHPVNGLTVRQMLDTCPDTGWVRLWGKL
jgi:2-amino-4-hydroxy-6-hydroxymethyldihydropteridine diphosphokinase